MIDGECLLHWLSSRRSPTFGKGVIERACSDPDNVAKTRKKGGWRIFPLVVQGHVEMVGNDRFVMVPPVFYWQEKDGGFASLHGARTPLFMERVAAMGGIQYPEMTPSLFHAHPVMLKGDDAVCREKAINLEIGFCDTPILSMLRNLPDFDKAVSALSPWRNFIPSLLSQAERLSVSGKRIKWSGSNGWDGRRGMYRIPPGMQARAIYFVVCEDAGPPKLLDWHSFSVAVCHFSSVEGLSPRLTYFLGRRILTIDMPISHGPAVRLPVLLERFLYLAAQRIDMNGCRTDYHGILESEAEETARIIGVFLEKGNGFESPVQNVVS